MVARVVICRKCGMETDHYKNGYCEKCFHLFAHSPINKVYIVIQDQWYGGIVIDSVFANEDRAISYIKNCKDNISRSIDTFKVF